MASDDDSNVFERVGADAGAHANAMAGIQEWLRQVRERVEGLQSATSRHCREFPVEGDRWYHPGKRSRPLERKYRNLLRKLEQVNSALEECAESRKEFDAAVKQTRIDRWQKRNGNRPIALPGERSNSAANTGRHHRPAPTSIYTRKGESA